MATFACRAMVARAFWIVPVLGWLTLAPHGALADGTAVQNVPCESGAERQTTIDGGISRCRLAATANLLVDPAGGNGEVACAAGSMVEFNRSGYLAFCGAAATAATFRGRAGRETRCRAGARLAFGETGYLEYCS